MPLLPGNCRQRSVWVLDRKALCRPWRLQTDHMYLLSPWPAFLCTRRFAKTGSPSGFGQTMPSLAVAVDAGRTSGWPESQGGKAAVPGHAPVSGGAGAAAAGAPEAAEVISAGGGLLAPDSPFRLPAATAHIRLLPHRVARMMSDAAFLQRGHCDVKDVLGVNRKLRSGSESSQCHRSNLLPASVYVPQ